MVVHQLGPLPVNARGASLITGQGAKMPHDLSLNRSPFKKKTQNVKTREAIL